jgi:hypothetical protein
VYTFSGLEDRSDCPKVAGWLVKITPYIYLIIVLSSGNPSAQALVATSIAREFSPGLLPVPTPSNAEQ